MAYLKLKGRGATEQDLLLAGFDLNRPIRASHSHWGKSDETTCIYQYRQDPAPQEQR